MEYVIHSLQHVSHQLLLELNLNRGVGHQQWVGDCHLDALDILLPSLLVCVLIRVLHASFLLRRDPLLERNVLRVYYFVNVHVYHDNVLRLITGIIIIIGTWPSSCRRSCALRVHQGLLLI